MCVCVRGGKCLNQSIMVWNCVLRSFRQLNNLMFSYFRLPQRNAAGDLGLQPTPLAAAMSEFIRDHLEADGAWPCFLAATTLKLAQQQQQH